MGFGIDQLVSELVGVLEEGTRAPAAARQVLERVVSDPAAIEAELPAPDQAPVFSTWHHASDLTVLHVIWPPEVDLFPHDHQMWAAIGLYGGREDNRFYRRLDDETIEPTTEKRLRGGDAVALGSDTLHSVANPSREWTGAIHVYGGDYFGAPRTMWTGPNREPEPFDVDRTEAVLREAGDRARR